MIFGPLHQLARARSDGLWLELCRLLASDTDRTARAENVTELPVSSGHRVAGPAPALRVHDSLPENVVRFDRGAGERTLQQTGRSQRD